MTPWDKFFKDKMTQILMEKSVIIDIGGGLRVSKKFIPRSHILFESVNDYTIDRI